MKKVVVRFPSSAKEYAFNTGLDLIVGGVYQIFVGNDTYTSPVQVIRYTHDDYPFPLRIITNAVCVSAPKRKSDGIKKVYFNEEKGTTVVVWKDGMKTKVKCCEGDTFNREAGLALCYMKRILGNRGAFNETLKRYCTEDNDQ